MKYSTKIRYIKVLDKIYDVMDISFYYMNIRAAETQLRSEDVSPEELFDISDFRDFKVTLINNSGQAEIIEFTKKN